MELHVVGPEILLSLAMDPLLLWNMQPHAHVNDNPRPLRIHIRRQATAT